MEFYSNRTVRYFTVIHEIDSGSLPGDAAGIGLEAQRFEREAARSPHAEFARWVGNRAYSASLALDTFSVKHIMPNLLVTEQHQQAFVAATMISASLRHVGKFMHRLGTKAAPRDTNSETGL